ncbi:protein phosphatase 1, regulatory subunit 13Bb isoform X3 [Pimephales promelas]|uniref:protein phosphatase 1, regulatory subunit 13Bb isoform X3 n=1 Tax=Pimephales promelas TaxID=90988 RepID=UPI001955702A|nr:protein phosphatase 1, regulatory subunit 13Bb isoform X3 [Pimephales promelas]KAG1964244.1 apoptosis-stimulating of p53 protein [Pimephales promelas]KAG1964247.1 apoptosis-stimulating of p53 protein [Pimephales promelas]KAG1964248.1 apoptosis-stimulating of p53 protein [Pimephales promelas]
MMPMILMVYLSDGEQALTEVPITPETTCRDVVEFCKEPGESGCHLAEVWRGNERPIPFDHMMYEHLQKWGPRKQEVKFYLRHEDSPTESSDQGSQQSQEQPSRRGGSSSDMHNENGVGNPRVELTLSELQEMATRQQQQIEAQQQMLVAKEQRLRYLKQQERRQQQAVSETEKLQRLKERVESQEAKLKKIRAMRGQVDYSKVINGNLSAEIEHISGLFQEKQAELQSAVSRVDQLSQQLEDLRRGKLNGLQTLGGQVTGNAALELRKLYQELQIRNKLNQEQNSKLQQQKELLNKRNMEVTLMDKRINELRDRLYKRKAEARQKENLPLNRVNGPPSPQSAHGNTGRVAAVGPYIQVPVPGRQEGYVVPPEPLKPQSLGVNTPANHARSKSANDASWPTLNKSNTSVKPPDWKESGTDTSSKTASPAGTPADKIQDSSKMGSGPPLNKPQPPPYGAHTSNHPLSSANSGSTSSLDRRKDVPLRPVPSLPSNPPPLPAWPRVPPTPSGSSSQQIQQRISVPPSPTFQPSPPFFPPGERPDPPLAVAVRPFIPDKGSRPQSPRKGPATMNSSSIYHMYLQQAAPKNYPLNIKPAVKAVYGKPVLPPSSTPPSPLLFGGPGAFPALQGPGGDMLDLELDFDGQMMGVPEPPPPSVDHIPRPLSPTKLTPMVHSPMRYQSDAELEVLRKKLANAPRPLKKRSSITEPEGPNGPNIQKLLYQRFNTLAGGMEGGMGGVSGSGGVTPFYQPSVATGEMLFDADNGNPPSEMPSEGAVVEDVVLQGDANDNEPLEQAVEQLTPPAPEPSEDSNNNPAEPVVVLPSPVAEASTPEEADTSPSSQPTGKRTNLKKPDSERTGHGLRVKFNPLALLLDASLEGEFDLVQRIIYEVVNPSTPNDEGITPLHNSVCAGHHHIVKFLLDFGVNVNAADSDGWTPLHCAASCNSVHLCKLLVESGAAIFATTISDVETAADKCEEMEEGFIQCSQFLYGVQEKLGVMNKGVVYALWDYEAQSADELSFQEGDAITVLRRKDDTETDWWWSKLNDKEGYVPRNLLGLYPRIKPRQRSLA